MLKKTLLISTLAAGLAVAALPAQARHHHDRAAGALIGASIGGHVNGGDGAVVGGLLGAVAGAGVAHGGYDGRYYSQRCHQPSRRYQYRDGRDYYREGRGYYGDGRGYLRVGGWRDADGDGVPNRYDRAPYNPRWW